MNSLWDIRIFLGLVPKVSYCICHVWIPAAFGGNGVLWQILATCPFSTISQGSKRTRDSAIASVYLLGVETCLLRSHDSFIIDKRISDVCVCVCVCGRPVSVIRTSGNSIATTRRTLGNCNRLRMFGKLTSRGNRVTLLFLSVCQLPVHCVIPIHQSRVHSV